MTKLNALPYLLFFCLLLGACTNGSISGSIRQTTPGNITTTTDPGTENPPPAGKRLAIRLDPSFNAGKPYQISTVASPTPVPVNVLDMEPIPGGGTVFLMGGSSNYFLSILMNGQYHQLSLPYLSAYLPVQVISLDAFRFVVLLSFSDTDYKFYYAETTDYSGWTANSNVYEQLSLLDLAVNSNAYYHIKDMKFDAVASVFHITGETTQSASYGIFGFDLPAEQLLSWIGGSRIGKISPLPVASIADLDTFAKTFKGMSSVVGQANKIAYYDENMRMTKFVTYDGSTAGVPVEVVREDIQGVHTSTGGNFLALFEIVDLRIYRLFEPVTYETLPTGGATVSPKGFLVDDGAAMPASYIIGKTTGTGELGVPIYKPFVKQTSLLGEQIINLSALDTTNSVVEPLKISFMGANNEKIVVLTQTTTGYSLFQFLREIN